MKQLLHRTHTLMCVELLVRHVKEFSYARRPSGPNACSRSFFTVVDQAESPSSCATYNLLRSPFEQT